MASPPQRLSGPAAASLVRELKNQVIQAWQQRVLREVYAAGEQDRPALIDSLPDFLVQLSRTLTAPASPAQAEHNAQVAEVHGEERAQLPGYTLSQVIYEYQVLREVLVETLEQRQELAPEAVRILHASIDQAIRVASVRFVELSQENLGRAERSISLKERELEQLFASSAGPLAFFAGQDFVYARVSPRYLELLPDRDLLGKPVLEAVPELAGSEFLDILRHVYQTGEPTFISEGRIDLKDQKRGVLRPRYFDALFSRIDDLEGKPVGIFNSAMVVKAIVEAHHGRVTVTSTEETGTTFTVRLPRVLTPGQAAE